MTTHGAFDRQELVEPQPGLFELRLDLLGAMEIGAVLTGRSNGDRAPTGVAAGPWTLVGSAGTRARAAWPASGATAAPTRPAAPATSASRRETAGADERFDMRHLPAGDEAAANEDDYHGRPDGSPSRAVLSAGGSRDAYELLQEDGIDVATDTPYDALIARMDRIMDEIEGILDRR